MTTAPDRLLRRLEWQILRRLDGRLQGSYRTVFRGAGIDFADLRSYTPEDDVRHIDWNVTARLDEVYVRRYNEDRDLTAWLVLDRSASMRFGRDDHGKDDALTELALCLARLLSQGGNRVGAILFDNTVQQILPPRSSRVHVLRLAHELTRAPRTDSAARPAKRTSKKQPPASRTPTNLAAMLELAAATAKRRSLVFVVSDFISESEWELPLGRLARRHEVVAIHIVDPLELEIPDLGLVLVEDAETGEQLLVDTADPTFRRRFGDEVQARDSALASTMNTAGVAVHRISTDQDLAAALIDMVRRTKIRRR